MEELIKGYKEGSDITILDCFYQYPQKQEDGKYSDDLLIIVYRDNMTGQKKHQIFKCPEYTFYKTKEGVTLDHNYFFIDKDLVEPVTCKFTDIEKTIAEVCPQSFIDHTDLNVLNSYANNLDWFYGNLKDGDRSENKKLHTIADVFRSDMSIEDYYRFLFGKYYTNNSFKLHKAFFDIEVDTRWMSGDFVQMGECAVNAIAFHDEEEDIIISFLLRDSRNPQIEEFEHDLIVGNININEIRKFLLSAIGGKKQLIRYKLDKTNVEFRFFDNELEMIYEFFQTVHKYSPDFIEGWNSSGFDIQYLGSRITTLGARPEDIMCDKNWDVKIIKHFIDNKNLSNFAERGDYTFISGHTVWIDQMIQYASRRKAKIGSFASFKLDDIGASVAKVHKLDYHDITLDIGMLPWLNFKTFVYYNIFDVVVQKCIELKSQDLEYIFLKCIVNNTSYKKGHRQTVYLINRMAKEFDNLGFIIGNNINKWNEKPDKFSGALVGDPLHTDDYAKMKINGVPISVCELLQDYDYKSLYPSITLENNIAPNTQIGRVIIDEKIYDNENAMNDPRYQRGGEFIENLVTDNIIEFCKRWLHFGGVAEVLEDMEEFFGARTFSATGNIGNYYFDTSKQQVYTIPVFYGKTIEPIAFTIGNAINPIMFIGEGHKEVDLNMNSMKEISKS